MKDGNKHYEHVTWSVSRFRLRERGRIGSLYSAMVEIGKLFGTWAFPFPCINSLRHLSSTKFSEQ